MIIGHEINTFVMGIEGEIGLRGAYRPDFDGAIQAGRGESVCIFRVYR